MKEVLLKLNPMKENVENSKISFCIQKILAFFMIYMVAAIIFEGIIIGGFALFGYDVLHGIMPEGSSVARIPFYGRAGFAIITLLYVKHIEKRKLSDMKIVWNRHLLNTFLKGTLIGGMLVVLMVGLFLVFGLAEFEGRGSIFSFEALFWMLAYFIQSCTEEIMCRGFLQTSLSRRLKPIIAIIISSVVFMLPHLSGILEIGGGIMIVSLLNLLLVSCLFSVIMMKENSLGAACGLHFGWNYSLGILLGLTVSGGNKENGVVQILVRPGHNLVTGGMYGMEASLLLIPILLFCIFGCRVHRRKRSTYGV